MPYSEEDYPASLKNLPMEIREKAIEILNSLINEDNMEVGFTIPTAISRAKDWAVKKEKAQTHPHKLLPQ